MAKKEAATESEVTMSELTTLEDLEYVEATRKLLLDPSFHTFLVRWLVDTSYERMSATAPEELHNLNWRLARASLMEEFMEGIAETDSAQYLKLTQEKLDYGRRRRAASSRGDDRTSRIDAWREPDIGDDTDSDY